MKILAATAGKVRTNSVQLTQIIIRELVTDSEQYQTVWEQGG